MAPTAGFAKRLFGSSKFAAQPMQLSLAVERRTNRRSSRPRRGSLGDTLIPVGTRLSLDGDSVVGRVFRTGAATRIDSYLGAEGSTAEVARGLGCRREAAAVRLLAAAAKDPSPEVAEQAVSALARVGTAEAIESLIGALDTKDEGLRETIATSLSDLTHQSFGMNVDDWRQWWHGRGRS